MIFVLAVLVTLFHLPGGFPLICESCGGEFPCTPDNNPLIECPEDDLRLYSRDERFGHVELRCLNVTDEIFPTIVYTRGCQLVDIDLYPFDSCYPITPMEMLTVYGIFTHGARCYCSSDLCNNPDRYKMLINSDDLVKDTITELLTDPLAPIKDCCGDPGIPQIQPPKEPPQVEPGYVAPVIEYPGSPQIQPPRGPPGEGRGAMSNTEKLSWMDGSGVALLGTALLAARVHI